VLDEDDVLNPEETLRRYKLGIDTKYLVKHFGEGDTSPSSTNRSPRYTEFIDEEKDYIDSIQISD